MFRLRSVTRALPRTEENDVPDIGETLTQLDRQLAEIRHRLDGLAERPGASPPPPPPARRPLPLPTPGELEEETAHAQPVTAGTSQLDRELVQVVDEGVGRLGSQIEQLLRIREGLITDVRELLTGYRRRLDELELQDVSEFRSALDSLLVASASDPAPPGGVDELLSRPAFFEGTVDVAVGPATRIQTIQVLEDALARVRHVEQVYIRRWHAGELWLEVTVSSGVELLGELNRVLPFPFAVQSASGQAIVIRLEGER